MNRRPARVAELLRAEISDVMRREMKDPRLSAGLVSIVSVDVTPDLRSARIHVSVLGSEADQEAALAGLRAGQGFLRSQLGERLTLKRIPTLEFHLDRSIEQGARVLDILSHLNPGS